MNQASKNYVDGLEIRIKELIAERDALLNENSEVKRLRDAWQKEAQELLAERDALRLDLIAALGQQLDAAIAAQETK